MDRKSKREESELVRRCSDGDEAAWDAFVERYLPYLAWVVRGQLRSVPDEATREALVDDILQDCLLALWENDRRVLKAYDGRGSLTAYLRMVAIHRTLKRLEAQKRFDRSVSQEPFLFVRPEAPDVSLLAQNEEERRRLENALEALPPREHLVLLWVRGEKKSYEEAARLLHLSPNTIGPLLARAEKRLRELLKNGPPSA